MDQYTDLSNAIVGEELTPLQFDRTEYTPFEEFISTITSRLSDTNAKGERRKIKVSNKALSVNGRVVNDSMERYLTSKHLSSSALKEALKTPLHFFYYQQKTFKPKDTSHFELGTFIHSAFVEPKKFDRVAVIPKATQNTNDGLCKAIEFYWQLSGLVPDSILSEMKQQALRDKLRELKDSCTYSVIDESDALIVEILKRAYKSYGGGLLPLLLQNAKAEVSMYGVDQFSGQKVKSRPDAMLLSEDIGYNIIVSIKSTSATTLEAFTADAAKYRYELSEGMYLDVASQITGRDFTATIMIMAQTVIPFQIAVFYWNAEDLQIGKYKYRQAIDTVTECSVKGSYRGFEVNAEDGAHGIIQMKMPNWIKRELAPKYIEEN
ncbi:MAG: PD-(D/E)XK nuclease-like domain-containing protein [Mucinivorans sp.]